jgi:hypothetical protein
MKLHFRKVADQFALNGSRSFGATSGRTLRPVEKIVKMNRASLWN